MEQNGLWLESDGSDALDRRKWGERSIAIRVHGSASAVILWLNSDWEFLIVMRCEQTGSSVECIGFELGKVRFV